MVECIWFSNRAQKALLAKNVPMSDAVHAVATVLERGFSAVRINGVALHISSVEGGIGALLREELPDDAHNRAKLSSFEKPDPWVPWEFTQ